MRAKTYATADWPGATSGKRCHECGRPWMPSPVQQLTQWYSDLYTSLLESLARPGGEMAGAGAARSAWPHGPSTRHGGCGCGCGECWGCERDDCHCRCCIKDADLVIYARVGERRMVPITVENPRRRERQIHLDLGNWTTGGGRPVQVTGQIVPPADFTLKPCEEREVILVIEASQGQSESREGLPDVDCCEVFYADLRVEGCEVRPLRIALALLPRDCTAYTVRCGCGCC